MTRQHHKIPADQLINQATITVTVRGVLTEDVLYRAVPAPHQPPVQLDRPLLPHKTNLTPGTPTNQITDYLCGDPAALDRDDRLVHFRAHRLCTSALNQHLLRKIDLRQLPPFSRLLVLTVSVAEETPSTEERA